jgi:hypothetical protein
LKKGEQVVETWFNIRLTHSSIHTVHDSADRNKENSDCLDSMKCQQSETGSVCKARLRQCYHNETCQKLWMWVSYILLH